MDNNKNYFYGLIFCFFSSGKLTVTSIWRPHQATQQTFASCIKKRSSKGNLGWHFSGLVKFFFFFSFFCATGGEKKRDNSRGGGGGLGKGGREVFWQC